MKSIGTVETVIAAAYRDAEPQRFGTLHERMKWLINAIRGHGKNAIPLDVWNAIFVLEAEIKHHVPAKPPYTIQG
jgi:hypothetical protein